MSIYSTLRSAPHRLPPTPLARSAKKGLLRAWYSDSTKTLTPIEDGSALEHTDVRPDGLVIPAGMTSGAPEELSVRPVRIYRPSPTTMQSAKATSHTWRLDWDTLPGGGRWENPLMGWASSADYMQGTQLDFGSSEAAVGFCEKQGWPYYVQEPKKIKFKPKSYSENYVYSPDTLRLLKTK
ncbi:hypothetical protein CROQUDRAFT_662049 [Cronartium quercuum f. sp. fusiforme G11]|uniref:NADH dehydrogenase [ubiquinone] iron-sulfur protein 4, mitochondrial n=1 Tax=Cronartium quercuum f. sp. fusiforme G11 TaxID=708437 RepID=A0A9P6NA54_9BASI|nr:hypothetical protein CROQUDRAFT_662049 [Cronartium quercuum f. sp. fusiforme G11]